MIDEVDVFGDLDELGDVVLDELEIPIPKMLDVLQGAGVEVVDADHPLAGREQPLAEVGAEKACPTGYHRGTHLPPPR